MEALLSKVITVLESGNSVEAQQAALLAQLLQITARANGTTFTALEPTTIGLVQQR
jgi:hypothetical protein